VDIAGWSGRVLGGRYEVRRVLGQGGMGAVYEGCQSTLGRAVAIKLLRAELLEDPTSVLRFRREAEATARLGHPNIVQVIDFEWTEGEPPFLVMELLRGQSLRDLLKNEPALTEARVASIAVQVLAALDAAHAHGIVHRDLTPANIFLVEDAGGVEHVKLLDFGVAKLIGNDVSQITQGSSVVGTPGYLSPEQLAGSADERSDLYALGAVMYRALSGRAPFAGTWPEIVYALMHESPRRLRELRPDLGSELVAVVEKAMSRDPAQRPRSAAEMRADIERIFPRLRADFAYAREGRTETLRADGPPPAPAIQAPPELPSPAPPDVPVSEAAAPAAILSRRSSPALLAVALVVVVALAVVTTAGLLAWQATMRGGGATQTPGASPRLSLFPVRTSGVVDAAVVVEPIAPSPAALDAGLGSRVPPRATHGRVTPTPIRRGAVGRGLFVQWSSGTLAPYGERSGAEVAQMLRPAARRIASCLAQRGWNHPTYASSCARAEIAASGEVLSCEVHGHNADVDACLDQSLRGSMLAPPERPGRAELCFRAYGVDAPFEP